MAGAERAAMGALRRPLLSDAAPRLAWPRCSVIGTTSLCSSCLRSADLSCDRRFLSGVGRHFWRHAREGDVCEGALACAAERQ